VETRAEHDARAVAVPGCTARSTVARARHHVAGLRRAGGSVLRRAPRLRGGVPPPVCGVLGHEPTDVVLRDCPLRSTCRNLRGAPTAAALGSLHRKLGRRVIPHRTQHTTPRVAGRVAGSRRTGLSAAQQGWSVAGVKNFLRKKKRTRGATAGPLPLGEERSTGVRCRSRHGIRGRGCVQRGACCMRVPLALHWGLQGRPPGAHSFWVGPERGVGPSSSSCAGPYYAQREGREGLPPAYVQPPC